MLRFILGFDGQPVCPPFSYPHVTTAAYRREDDSYCALYTCELRRRLAWESTPTLRSSWKPLIVPLMWAMSSHNYGFVEDGSPSGQRCNLQACDLEIVDTPRLLN